MTIGRLAFASGVPASTIRYWESIGVLPKAARSGGQRRYRPDAIDRVAALKLAQSCGFRLAEMRYLQQGIGSDVPPATRWGELARKKHRELDDEFARLTTMRRLVDRVMQCRCADLPECGRIAASVMARSH